MPEAPLPQPVAPAPDGAAARVADGAAARIADGGAARIADGGAAPMADGAAARIADGAAARIAAFLAQLRANGFRTGPAEAVTALEALRHVPPQPPAPQQALKALLCGDQEQWERFDDLFQAFWFGRGVRTVQPATGAQVPNRSGDKTSHRTPPLWKDHLPSDPTAPLTPDVSQRRDDGGEHDDGGGRATGKLVAARSQASFRADLRHLHDPADMEAACETAARLAARLKDRLSRRRSPSLRGRMPDLRRTIRRNLAHGGDLHHLLYRRRPDRPVELVVFLDVSGSMEAYAKPFLMFVRGLLGQEVTAHAFLIHTRLVQIDGAFADRDPLAALARLSLLVQGYGGGTRLAHGIGHFNDRYAKAMVNSRSVVIILSDGYDSDPPERLSAELARLKTRARRLIWLNPLLGWRDYAPVARGMAAALPHIDHFAACNTLESLAALEPAFAAL